MELRRHAWMVGVLAVSVVVLALWVFSLDGPQGGAVQVASQVLMPVPLALGALACARRLRAHGSWAVPLLVFVLALPLVYEAWEARSRPPGEESCGAAGFLPDAPDWYEHEGYLFTALGLAALGLLATVSARWRAVGGWTAVAGWVWSVTFFAAGVCVGT